MWGSNAYIVQADIDMIKQVSTLIVQLQPIVLLFQNIYSYINIHSSLQVEDVSKWSPRMREPMEAVYGVEGFPNLWFET